MNSQKLSLFSFIFSALFIAFAVGFIVREFKLFPYKVYAEAVKGFEKIRDSSSQKLPWYYARPRKPFSNIANDSSEINPGLTLVTRISKQRQISADIIDLQGNIIHQWKVDWFKLWPDAKHIPEKDIPREQPGTHIHGAVVMNNGDLIFNFENKGLIRLNRDSEVVWRLPYMTHHSVHHHDDGNIWVSGRKNHNKQISRLPHLYPPFYEDTILVVSPEGKILKEWNVADILRDNGHLGLLYLGTLNDRSTALRDKTDIFHLNDVEPFSNQFKEGFFTRGDVLVSLRNINTVFVFNSETNKIKYMSIGQFVRQHDPDFIDGNTFSVFDNNNDNTINKELNKSRIVVVSAKENTHEVYFEGSIERPFFTNIMGKHQWLPNGNVLITDPLSGRGFEINQEKNIVWQYVNYVDEGVIGLVEQVDRLPIEYNQVFPTQK